MRRARPPRLRCPSMLVRMQTPATTRRRRLVSLRCLLPPLCVALASVPLARAQDGGDAPGAEPPAADASDSDKGAAADKPLLYLGLNEHGAEEWFRVRDRAVVVRVPAGAYQQRPYESMSTTADPEPVEVESYFVDKHEVTNAQLARFLTARPGAATHVDFRVPGIERTADGGFRAAAGRERHPATAANGLAALAYAEWVGGSLPTRERWEKAAGGPEGRVYPWGDEAPDATRANFALANGPSALSVGTAPVGSYAAGASYYGCLDMAGNAYERVLTPGRRTKEGGPVPTTIKGGAWVSPHPLNLRVLDLCMQGAGVAERSVGFRCTMDDPDPDRPSRTAKEAPRLRFATSWKAAVAEARRRRVPLFVSLLYDTCGQCDRTRAQCYADPRFVAYCNEHLVVVIGHDPGDAFDEPHPPLDGGACSLYPGLTCEQHEQMYSDALKVVRQFVVSPGNFVLHPDRAESGAGEDAQLVREFALPKWGNAVETYIEVFERCRGAVK